MLITSLLDDSVAGDTNKDGAATLPAPGDWRGLIASSGSTLSMVHGILRYAGYAGTAVIGVNTTSATAQFHAVHVEQAQLDGFSLQTADWLRDCIAWNCGRDGFSLLAGSFDLTRSTAVANGRYGVNDAAAHNGLTEGTIAWNNATANYNGDLRLGPASICIDTGNPFDQPSGYDLAGFPRLLDGDFNYFRRLDMGAHEFDHIELTLSGTPTLGGNISLDMNGTAGLSTWLFLGVATFELPFKTFGPLAVDVSQPSLLLNWLPVPSSLPLAIPLDYPLGIPAYVQALGLNGTLASDTGNMSNLLTVLVE